MDVSIKTNENDLKLPSILDMHIDKNAFGYSTEKEDVSSSHYIKFDDGLMICFGLFSKCKHYAYVEFPISFISTPILVATRNIGTTFVTLDSKFGFTVCSDSGLGFYVEAIVNDDSSNAIWGSYIAIGYWK